MRNLIERIQEHIADTIVISARLLPIEGEGDAAIHPFIYRTDAAGEMRGAFTNGDPIWEENDPEAFAACLKG